MLRSIRPKRARRTTEQKLNRLFPRLGNPAEHGLSKLLQLLGAVPMLEASISIQRSASLSLLATCPMPGTVGFYV